MNRICEPSAAGVEVPVATPDADTATGLATLENPAGGIRVIIRDIASISGNAAL
ncbi:MAG: hypothetical protein ACFB03_19230 [Paracoccaceae bacterium]